MKIKTKKLLCTILCILPIIYTSLLMQFLPEQIPAHYGIDGTVDRYGSRLECLIFPLCILAFGVFMFIAAWFSQKNGDESKNNQSITLIASACVLILFNVMQIYFLYTSANSVLSLSSVKIDLYSLMCFLFGIMLIVVGNFMPKLRMNSLIGLRTNSSMKNEETWHHSQRFAGWSGIACGIILLISSTFVRSTAAILFLLFMLFVMTIADIIYSYIIAKKY